MNRSLRYGTKVPPVEMTVPVSFHVLWFKTDRSTIKLSSLRDSLN